MASEKQKPVRLDRLKDDAEQLRIGAKALSDLGNKQGAQVLLNQADEIERELEAAARKSSVLPSDEDAAEISRLEGILQEHLGCGEDESAREVLRRLNKLRNVQHPKKIRVIRPHAFYNKYDKLISWHAGQELSDPDDIALLIERGADIQEIKYDAAE